MITIRKSPTADTRTCDYANVTKETLLTSSRLHISEVRQALGYFRGLLYVAGEKHDLDKISDIDGFYEDFVTGFQRTEWWDRHRTINRHHLLEADGVPEDVNLIDVLDLIADCVCAGMARSGSVYPLHIDPEVLMTAFLNTVEVLKHHVTVVDGSEAGEG
jgi:hypothetical protein